MMSMVSCAAQPRVNKVEGSVPAGEIMSGADRMEVYLPLLKNKKVAVFANPTSMVGGQHLVDTLLKSGIWRWMLLLFNTHFILSLAAVM